MAYLFWEREYIAGNYSIADMVPTTAAAKLEDFPQRWFELAAVRAIELERWPTLTTVER